MENNTHESRLHSSRPLKNWHKRHQDSLTFGERIADIVAATMGSWTFIIWQTAIVLAWIVLNLVAYFSHWDPYPFILLNLLFSTQAAYAAPVIMMSQNRSADRDRHQAQADYETNIAAKDEIEHLQLELTRIENDKLDKILEILREKK